MPQPGNIPIELMDWNEGLSRVGDDEEFFVELLEDLVELGEETINSISEMLKINDTSDIERLGHSLKGAAANLGVNGLRDPSAKIESEAKIKKFDNMSSYLSEIEIKVNELRNVVKNT